jgi:hypothetical protein
MLHPPRGSPTPGGFFISKLENEGQPDQHVSVKIDSHTALVTAHTRSAADCTAPPAVRAAARIVVLIIIVLLVSGEETRRCQ